MVFFKRHDLGRIYVIRMVLPDDTVVHKVGMTNTSRSVDRMMEILRSWFMQFRFVPYSELKMDKPTSYPKEFEAHLHKILEHKRFVPNKKVDGGTEMFVEVDEFRLLQYIKMFNEGVLPTCVDLTDQDYKHLGEWLTP